MFWLVAAAVFQLALAGRLALYASFLHAKDAPAEPTKSSAIVHDVP